MKYLSVLFLIMLITILSVSCAGSGQYMPLAYDEELIGTIQADFSIRSTFFSMERVKDVINLQAYIHLMEEAKKTYDGNFDIRNIVWVTGGTTGYDNKEIHATGKIIRID